MPRAMLVHMADERNDAAIEVKSGLPVVALVDELDAQSLREVGHLAEALRQHVEAVIQLLEHLEVRQET